MFKENRVYPTLNSLQASHQVIRSVFTKAIRQAAWVQLDTMRFSRYEIAFSIYMAVTLLALTRQVNPTKIAFWNRNRITQNAFSRFARKRSALRASVIDQKSLGKMDKRTPFFKH